MLGQCWSNIYDAGPTLNQQFRTRLLGNLLHARWQGAVNLSRFVRVSEQNLPKTYRNIMLKPLDGNFFHPPVITYQLFQLRGAGIYLGLFIRREAD